MATARVRREEKVEFHTVEVAGTTINFPFTPYPLQVDVFMHTSRPSWKESLASGLPAEKLFCPHFRIKVAKPPSF